MGHLPLRKRAAAAREGASSLRRRISSFTDLRMPTEALEAISEAEEAAAAASCSF